MARCRIYFFTYNRNNLIPRSIKSLLNQTFDDWICEVHNDLPDNKFPEDYIIALNDSRFIVNNHLTNLGGTVSLNLAFSGCEEEYVSILEDDNWWEPTFLEEMVSLMDHKPDVDVSWSNMRIWEERHDDIWLDTGKLTGSEKADELFSWPQNKQAFGALHSIGAMMYRGINARDYLIPNESLLDAVELIRERSFKHPIYFNSKVLANFSITAFTNRSKDSLRWTACQAMLLSSLIVSSSNQKESFQKAVIYYRHQKPNPMANFFLANIFILKDRSLFKIFNLFDWFVFGKWVVRNGFKLINFEMYMESQRGVYEFLKIQTRERFLNK